MSDYVIRIHRHGGPEELVREAIEPPRPSPGEALVRNAAVGLNFIDVNHRVGRYPLSDFPRVIGMEGAGRVEAFLDHSTHLESVQCLRRVQGVVRNGDRQLTQQEPVAAPDVFHCGDGTVDACVEAAFPAARILEWAGHPRQAQLLSLQHSIDAGIDRSVVRGVLGHIYPDILLRP